MDNPVSEQASVWSGLAVLFRAFARRGRNWVVLARNLIPVIGVYLLGWSKGITTFSYWFDGLCMVAMIVFTFCIRVPEEKFRSAPWHRVPYLLLVTALCGAFAFGMIGIPYWMAYGALDMDFAVDEIRRNPYLVFSFAGMFVATVVNALQRGGYLRLSNDELKARWENDLHNLGARALAMVMIAGWNLGALLVPLIALLLTGIEVWPTLRDDVMPPTQTASPARVRGKQAAP